MTGQERDGEVCVCAVSDEDKPRPFEVDGGAKDTVLSTEAAVPLLPFPACISRIALAPKLMRRAKGDVGGFAEESPSSNGLSSTEPELALDMLAVREWKEVPKEEGCDEEPVKPTVDSDKRRCA